MKQRFSVVRFLIYLVGFTSLPMLRLVVSPDGQGGITAFVACVAALAAGYMVYYASSEGYLRNLMSGVVMYLALAAVVAACPPFVLVLAFWSLASLLKRRRALLVHAMSSIALFVLIFPMPLAQRIGMPELAGAPAAIAYIGFAVAWSAWASCSPLKLGLFKFSTMLLAVPLIASFVALVGGGMFSRPERRVRNSLMRARKALTLTLPAPEMAVRSEVVVE
ncbi:hypothetical protein AWB73_00927 [Caballeronia turbans]|jgi:hypothetical protein|uniref:hypothetical protein n=1 Tax=unclassified Caballeronia TaxID=2646786 RepID=UPI00074BC4BD|nr:MULTISPECIES: hypothetical protein [unclassified Caballeronia]SAL17189.1 hypothetical protein AWB73_00927 [Caballeronia turbans]